MVAQAYGCSDDLLDFVPDNFPQGGYALAGSGAVLKVISWTQETSKGEPVKHLASVFLWAGGWTPEDIIAKEDGAFPIQPKAYKISSETFESTDGKAWLFDPLNAEVEAIEEDVEEEEEGLPDVKIEFGDETEEKEEEAQETEPVDTEADPTEELPVEKEPVPVVEIEETELSTSDGTHLRGRLKTLYRQIYLFGPTDMVALEEWAWETKLFGKTAKSQADMYALLTGAFEDLRDKHNMSIWESANDVVCIGSPELQVGSTLKEPTIEKTLRASIDLMIPTLQLGLNSFYVSVRCVTDDATIEIERVVD